MELALCGSVTGGGLESWLASSRSEVGRGGARGGLGVPPAAGCREAIRPGALEPAVGGPHRTHLEWNAVEQRLERHAGGGGGLLLHQAVLGDAGPRLW